VSRPTETQLHIHRHTHSNHLTLTHSSETLLMVPMKPTGKAQAMIRPIVAAQEIRYLDFISRAPSSKLAHTMSLGFASSHLSYILNG